MKLTIREDSTNYAAVVVKLPVKQDVTGLDKLKKVTVFGNDVLTGKDADPDILYVFFPAETQLAAEYLAFNNEYRHENLNCDPTKKGFFEDSGRVKAIRFRGVISTGYIAPVSSLDGLVKDYTKLREGDEFTTVDGFDICKKYRPVRIQSTTSKESRFNKKLTRFDRLVPNQFRFHSETPQLARNMHQFERGDIIVITDKWHGASAVFANVLVKRELNWFQRLMSKIHDMFLGKTYYIKYDILYSSRSVLKNQYINNEATSGYYGIDVWKAHKGSLEGKIEPGITLYGEIVGFTPTGGEIQKGYDYGCKTHVDDDINGMTIHAESKFLVYRITSTNNLGVVREFSWQQIKDYCKKYGIMTVKELYFGSLQHNTFEEGWREKMLADMEYLYLEHDCVHCKNKVPAEGVVVRIDGRETVMAYKLKSKRFFERETKALDKGEVDMESDQSEFDWYVDAEKGKDTNSGKSPSEA